MQLTRRDELLLQMVALWAKAATPTQWWSECWPPGATGLRACNRRVQALCEEGLVDVGRGWAGVVAQPDRPLVTWAPGAPPPDLAEVRARSMERWTVALRRMRSVRYLQATARGAARVGGVTTPIRPSELSHDLLLTGALLATLRRYPNVAARWENERVSGGAGRSSKGFDAMIRMPGQPIAVEVVGESYTLNHLVDLHAVCERLDWRYQLW